MKIYCIKGAKYTKFKKQKVSYIWSKTFAFSCYYNKCGNGNEKQNKKQLKVQSRV